MPRPVPALLALATVGALTCPVAMAAEGDVRVADVRVAIGVGPMPDEQDGTITAPAAQVGTNVDQRYDDTPGLSVTIGGRFGRLSPFGVLIGGELRSITGEMAYDTFSFAGTDYTADELEQNSGDKVPGMSFSQTGVALNLGVGLAIGRSWHIELLGLAGIDWTTWDGIATPFSSNISVQDGSGWGHTFGGRAGVYWTDPETGWQFGVESEYTRTETEFEISYVDVSTEADIENSGVSLRAVIGHRF